MKKFLVPGLGRSVGVAIAALALGTQIAVLGLAGFAVANRGAVRDWLVVGKSIPTATLDGYAVDAGMSSAGRFYLYATKPVLHSPETFDESCPIKESGIAVLGCYDPSADTIHLLDITDDQLTTLEPVVAAHEMLHAVWARLDSAEQNRVGRLVDAAYRALPTDQITTRLAAYGDLEATTRTAELFALLGTEVSVLPEELEAVYARYFDDRSRAVVLAANAARIFDSITTEIAELVAEIEAAETNLTAVLAQFTKDRAKLDADIDAFNAKSNTPGGFTSRSAFVAARDALTARQTAIEAQRTRYNTLVDEFNVMLDNLDVLNAQAVSLNAALGIDASEFVPLPTVD